MATMNLLHQQRRFQKGKQLSDHCLRMMQPSKKAKCIPPASSTSHGEECVITAAHRPAVPQTEWRDYRYYPIDRQWQMQKCEQLGLHCLTDKMEGQISH